MSASDPFDASGDFRRRRTRVVQEEQPAEIRAAETMEVALPSQRFRAWQQILQAVREEIVTRSDVLKPGEASVAPDIFYSIVAQLCDRHSEWGISPGQLQHLVPLLSEEFYGFGPLAPYMALDGLEEIICNRHDRVFIIVKGEKRRLDPSPFHSDKEVIDFLDRIFAAQGRELNLANPAEDGQLADGSRIHAEIPPLSVLGPCFAIRKFRPQPFTMDDYLQTGMFTQEFLDALQAWIDAQFNIVISGGTGSGKAQPLDEPVLTPSGYRRMGDLAIGDEVIGADGAPTRIVGVFPQGEKDVYSVHMADGGMARCCPEHLWSVRAAGTEEPFQAFPLQWVCERMRAGVLFEVPGIAGANGIAGRPRQIVAIRAAGRADAQCIKVAAEDGLYVTRDRIVTHNTTFINAIGALLPDEDRLIIIENTKELQIETEDTVYIQAIMRGALEGKGDQRAITIRDGLRYALRLRPDRIIVGEVRSAEAFDLLQAMNTGHDGSLTTVHANSGQDSIARIESLAVGAAELPLEAIQDLVARTVDVVIQVGRFRGTPYRKVLEAWQVLHPLQVQDEAKDRLESLLDSGVAVRVRSHLVMVPLFLINDDGTLDRHEDPLPIVGKRPLSLPEHQHAPLS